MSIIIYLNDTRNRKTLNTIYMCNNILLNLRRIIFKIVIMNFSDNYL